jgi:hypothetical protein
LDNQEKGDARHLLPVRVSRQTFRSFAGALLVAIVLTAPEALATADGCAVVLKTPDGFLNLRRTPTTGSEVVAKLSRGHRLYVDTATCETSGSLSICSRGTEWTHVIRVPRLDGKAHSSTRGWVIDRYVQWFDCYE